MTYNYTSLSVEYLEKRIVLSWFSKYILKPVERAFHEIVHVAAPLVVDAVVTTVTGNPFLGAEAASITVKVENGQSFKKAVENTLHDNLSDLETNAIAAVASFGITRVRPLTSATAVPSPPAACARSPGGRPAERGRGCCCSGPVRRDSAS